MNDALTLIKLKYLQNDIRDLNLEINEMHDDDDDDHDDDIIKMNAKFLLNVDIKTNDKFMLWIEWNPKPTQKHIKLYKMNDIDKNIWNQWYIIKQENQLKSIHKTKDQFAYFNDAKLQNKTMRINHIEHNKIYYKTNKKYKYHRW